MVDRIFAGFALAVVLAYGIIAFTVIKAPFQYDPLGPESWPQILSVAAGFCCLVILVKPDTVSLALDRHMILRLGVVVLVLAVYAFLFEPLGFVLATTLFCMSLAIILGGGRLYALLFGLVTGPLGYLIGSELLGLNLPDGILSGLW